MAEVELHPGSPQSIEPTSPIPISASWDATFASKYLFLGQDLSDGNPVAQPELVLEAQNLSVALWFNYDLDTNVGNEFDFYVQYGWDVENVSVAAGYAYYRYRYPAAFASVDCPVLLVHGDYDPHPGPLVRASLDPYVRDLTYVEIPRCGHSPWREREGRAPFFKLLFEFVDKSRTIPWT